MGGLWLGCCAQDKRMDLARALHVVDPASTLVFARDGWDLRSQLHDEIEREVGAIVGLTDEGISDMNIAAALVADGRAREVVLVCRGASGSLRSRAARAGINRVIDISSSAPSSRKSNSQGCRTEQSDASFVDPASTSAAPSSRRKKLTSVPAIDSSSGSEQDDGTADVGQQDECRQARRKDSERNFACRHRDQDGHVERGRATAPEEVASSRLSQCIDHAPILTIASGRGGVGKSALAALIAAKAAQWGMNVALLDFDLSCGNLGSFFGVRNTVDLARVATNGFPSNEAMGRCNTCCTDRVWLWGPCERPEMAETVMPHAGALIDYAASRYDLVVVDTSTTFTEAVASAAQRADRLLLVYVGGQEALGPLGRTSSLAIRLGVARTRIVRVENLANPREKAEQTPVLMETGFQNAPLARIADGYEEAAELMAQGAVADLTKSTSALSVSTARLLARMLSELGCLPDIEEARKAVRPETTRRRFSLFAKKQEAS